MNVIVNLAASIYYTLPIAQAAQYNISGVMALMEHLSSLPALQSFIHISTLHINQFNSGHYNNHCDNDYDKYTYEELHACYQECLQGTLSRLLQSNEKAVHQYTLFDQMDQRWVG